MLNNSSLPRRNLLQEISFSYCCHTAPSSVVTHDSLLNVAHDSDTNVEAPRKKPKMTTCEEIFPVYKSNSNGGMRDAIRVYSLYGATDSKSSYKVGYVVNLPTLCSVECTQCGRSSQTTKRGSIFQCDKCNRLRYVCALTVDTYVPCPSSLLILFLSLLPMYRVVSGFKIRQTIKDHASKLVRVAELQQKSEVTPVELKDMDDWTRTSNSNLSIEGIHLKKRIVLAVQFYKSLSSEKESQQHHQTSFWVHA